MIAPASIRRTPKLNGGHRGQTALSTWPSCSPMVIPQQPVEPFAAANLTVPCPHGFLRDDQTVVASLMVPLRVVSGTTRTCHVWLIMDGILPSRPATTQAKRIALPCHASRGPLLFWTVAEFWDHTPMDARPN